MGFYPSSESDFMKKKCTLMIIALMSLVYSTSAQIQQGNVMVGADIADFSLGLNEGGAFSVQINPKAAFFIRSGLAFGAYLNFGLSTSKGAGSNIDYGIGGLARYYISDPQTQVVRNSRFFAEGTIGIEGTNPPSGENTNGLGLSIGPGWTYFVTPNIGVEALLKYRGIVGFGSRATSSNLNLAIGFQIYLSKERARRSATGN
jgi:hypothetical protein